ncbi:TlyA family RNA methyltransferase [Hydrogenophaga sp.]|uniref:TlyA family RNA methyltransferase n=1 Tax=Hydrogenophaga sp. TaxID=1904254 RepID=UPI0027310FDF|nr:TlyA family RNA methyltransferase [Hydrogenophaga sp.]MDP2017295.1 TlyA family RNA methyltransferase [Hydrogenophaga sp.]MDP3164856.1 TlyA family RNA methyltransferase [Hydrogenophaga sp.]MDP3811438.1 TlyA family RNA methyltransferase [Hydrogenophaga sp.]
MRADQLLVERGLAASKSQAQRLIASGVRWRLLPGDWKTVSKNGEELRETVELQAVDNAETRFVSRGGLKLDGALQRVALDVRGLRCLDVGQSSGGFTDCLLQRGAVQVVGVDVGQGQLHPRLRSDARVVCIERCNARELTAQALLDAGGETATAPFDLIVGDLSFISQTLVWPALIPLLKAGGHVLMLVKPQFELQPEHIGKGGLVKSEASYPLVRERIEQVVKDSGLLLLDYFESPITGGDGNREFLVFARSPA